MSLQSNPPPRSAQRIRSRPARGKPSDGKPPGPRAAEPGPAIKVQIDFSRDNRLGPGKIKLLEMIGSEGSLSKGAERMGISYRRAWLFVQQINATFDLPAVSTPEHGHGGEPARLTDFGRELIRRYRELETLTDRAAVQTLEWLSRHLGRAE